MNARTTAAKVTFIGGAILALPALLGFLLPFLAAIAGDFEGGEQSWGGIMLFFLFGIPASVLLVASVLLHGWKKGEARVAYFVLGGIIAIPIAILVLCVVGVLISEAIKA